MKPADGALSSEGLRDWCFELRQAYLDIVDALLNLEMPELRTTDGEKVILQKLVFDIASAEEALEALKSLDFESTEAEPLEEIERDARGALQRAFITWKKSGNALHKHWSNTILGRIEITPGRMIAEVNSNERAETFRRIVGERLGDRARYRLSEVQSADKLLAQTQAQPLSEPDANKETLLDSPELQAYASEHLARYYEDWAGQEIPALGGRTPLQAVQDPLGREQVEALVRDIENNSARMNPAPDPAVFRRLRQQLGLADA